MNVKCVDNNNGQLSLTIGKIYDVDEDVTEEYWLIDDKGEAGIYKSTHFKILNET